MKPEEKPMRLVPSTGRSIYVSWSMDPSRAFNTMNVLCRHNSVQADSRAPAVSRETRPEEEAAPHVQVEEEVQGWVPGCRQSGAPAGQAGLVALQRPSQYCISGLQLCTSTLVIEKRRKQVIY